MIEFSFVCLWIRCVFDLTSLLQKLTTELTENT